MECMVQSGRKLWPSSISFMLACYISRDLKDRTTACDAFARPGISLTRRDERSTKCKPACR